MTTERRVKGRPCGDRILVKVMDHQVGTIFPPAPTFFNLVATPAEPLPETAPESVDVAAEPHEGRQHGRVQPSRGIIVSVGPGYVVHAAERFYVALDMKVGDEILFFEERGMKVTIDDEELVLLHAEYVLIVLDSLDGDPARAGHLADEQDNERD